MRILALTLGIIMALLPSQDSKINRLWSRYEQYDAADRPNDKLSTLEKIKELALESRSDWDYYDACRKYRDTRISQNWKLRAEAQDMLEREIELYGSPVMLFVHRYADSGDAVGFLEMHRQELLSTRNPRFYENDNMIHRLKAGKALPELIENDYMFCLWSLYSKGDAQAKEKLAALVRDSYPFGEIFALNEACALEDGEKKLALDSLAKAFGGRVTAMYAEAELLQMRFDELEDGEPETDEGYRRIDGECTGLLSKLRIALRSKEKAEAVLAGALELPSELSKTLKRQEINLRVLDDSLLVILRNLTATKVEISTPGSGGTVYSGSMSNPKCSFYLRDTLGLPLAFLQDGDYEIKAVSSKHRDGILYEKRSLSLAYRSNSDGTGVYVCDFMSGEPCGELTIVLKDSDKVIASCTLPAGEGFRKLPQSIVSKMDSHRWTYSLQAVLTGTDGKLRLSPDIGISRADNSRAEVKADPTLRAALLCDRSAFNPGETVHFKAVLYNDMDTAFEAAGAGAKVSADILDAEGKKISSKEIVSNEFGSLAGEFALPENGRGGIYTLRIRQGNRILGSKRLRVDEFVLPAFDLEWDADSRMYLSGDSPVVTGQLKSYSGHDMRVARAEYKVSLYGNTVACGNLELAADGSFRIRFDSAGERRYADNYIISVSVSEESGETQGFEKVIRVYGYLPFSTDVTNPDDATYYVSSQDFYYGLVVSGDSLALRFRDYREEGAAGRPELRVSYSLLDADGNAVLSGESGEDSVCADMVGVPDGLYTLVSKASAIADNGRKYSAENEKSILLLSKDSRCVTAPLTGFFRYCGTPDRPALQIASGAGELWAVVEFYGDGNVLLDSRCVYLEGVAGTESSLCTVEFDRPSGYSEYILKVLSFKGGEEMSWSHTVEEAVRFQNEMQLSFSRFTDETSPGTSVSIEARTAAGVECAAAVFDLASERIMPNTWRSYMPGGISFPQVYYRTGCGSHSSMGFGQWGNDMVLAGGGIMALRSTKSYAAEDSDIAVVEEAAYEESTAVDEPQLREEFGATLAWEPFLRSDAEGRVGFSFTAGDRLSTYIVQLFAHDAGFGNAVLRRQMTVSLPMAIQLSKPAFLYSGDIYSARVVLSSCSDEAASGRLSVKFIDGSDYGDDAKVLSSKEMRVKIDARGSKAADFEIEVPRTGLLGILVSFRSDGGGFSDAMFVTVPVRQPEQILTEAHSALLSGEAMRESVMDSLRRSFVNFDGSLAVLSERSVMELLLGELPRRFEPRSENVLDLIETLYADCLNTRIRNGESFRPFATSAAVSEGLDEARRDELVSKIMACRNADGGFGWLSGLPSSARITAVILEWCADMGGDCDLRIQSLLPDALDYIDNEFFKSPRAGIYRFGSLSVAEYLYVRSLYPEHGVKCDPAEVKDIVSYLEDRNSSGYDILSKARRIRTIEALISAGSGAFVESLGIKPGARMRSVARIDAESLLQYAQPHGSGGVYYPNAVMPLRGLLESELYAHVMLCALLDDLSRGELAEGIRLWIMVQKESQKWESDFAYLRALSAVLDGSEATLSAKVLALSATSPLEFGDIRPAGNGMSVSVSYTVDGKAVEKGQVLRQGDVLRAEYRVWNAENRSFVRLTVPNCAALRNVRELSGPFYVNWSACYRDVKADRVEYWLTVLPEEDCSFTEEYYVTQAGHFSSAAPVVESFYAPHYRANGAAGILDARR